MVMPEVTIDPQLSVYELVQRTKSHRALLNHRNTLLIVSREIENAIITDGARARVFAGFQRMSRFLPQVNRYRKLAENAESVYVFGIMDVEPPPIANVHYIPLKESDRLSGEWFVVADAPDYFSFLATEQMDYPETPETPATYQGVWSFDEELVTILQEWLSSLVDARPLGDLSERRDYRRFLAFITNSMFRLTTGLMSTVGRVTDPKVGVLAKEIGMVIRDQIGPAVHGLADWIKSTEHLPPAQSDSTTPVS